MSSNSTTPVKHSEPIAIGPSTRRSRSASLSSGSSGSDGSPPHTPASPTAPSRSMLPQSGSSPILSHFLAQSPAKSPVNATFPFHRKFGGPPPVFEEDEEPEIPVAAHARRTSTVVAGRFSQPQTSPLPDPQLERGTGLLRRLSLSTGGPAFAKSPPTQGRFPPSPPPNSAVSPTTNNMPFSQHARPRRSATINEGSKPRRAPSPMGERILKGHFDGFN
ncbi:hypothetical protein H0H92_009403 [Tricholoma furcatifolium]|nr:hypothetical protein H0H92_009403 [Tricholoma furcatifolium]